jgi:hypothetical protein
VAAGIFLLVLSCAAIIAGRGYVKTARRMRAFRTTRGAVVARELLEVPGDNREGRWGSGGGFAPKPTYTYSVDGVAHRSDRYSYAMTGLKRSVAEQRLAAIPDEVDVYYDPAAPQDAYLVKHTPTIGIALIAGGCVGALVGLVLALG